MGDLPNGIRPIRTCLKCHFLVQTKYTPLGSHTLTWSEPERDGSWLLNESYMYAAAGESEGYKPECYQNRWNIPNHPDNEQMLDDQLSMNRLFCIHFFKHRPEIAADDLESANKLYYDKREFVFKVLKGFGTIAAIVSAVYTVLADF